MRMKEEEDNDNSMESPSGTSCTMSLGDFSMASLGECRVYDVVVVCFVC